MKKEILHIAFIFALVILSHNVKAQAPTDGTAAKSKFNFSEVQIESETPDQYKTLEIRYINQNSTDGEFLTLNSRNYRYFTDKKTAVKFYYLVKKDSPNYEIYYVFSAEVKKAEVFTFRTGP